MKTATGKESLVRAESEEQPATTALPPGPVQPSERREEDREEADAEEKENAETEDEEQMEGGTNDAVPDDVAASPAAASASPAAVASKPADEDRRADVEKQPYEFDKCTVQIAVQLLPEDEDAKDRPVLLGVRTHLDAPIVRVLRLSELGELPTPINALVEQLKSELPAREQAAKDRIEKEKLELCWPKSSSVSV